jgi:UTP--glucose-1-phosphate uridylyltransferase
MAVDIPRRSPRLLGLVETFNCSESRVHPPIRKAVIPVAGLGTRLRPISAVVPKAMMPVPDVRGRVLPVLYHVLAEVAAAGVSEAAVVASPSHVDMLRAYLQAAAEASAHTIENELPRRVEVLTQREPLGFGHAVWLGKRFVGQAPFLVMLGDHIQVARAGQPACAAQVARAFARHGGAAMIGVQPVDAAELPRVGVAGGARLSGQVFRCASFVEKPSLALARKRLATPGLPKDHFLAHCGIYAFTPEIFDCLEDLMVSGAAGPRGARAQGPRHEVQLAGAQSILLERHPRDYYLVRVVGRAYDTGTPAGYVATWKAMLAATRVR